MKKTILSAILSICFVSLLGLTGCANAMVNDGNNVKKYTSSVSGAEGGAVPFKTFNEIFDLQEWNKNEDGSENGGGASTSKVGDSLCNTQKDGSGWWGVGFVSNGASPKPIYDMAGISKITFEAKGSRAGSKFKIGVFNGYGDDAEVTMEEEFQEYTVSVNPGTVKTAFLVWMSDSGTAPGDTFYIKNIAFYDASGNEVVPIVNE